MKGRRSLEMTFFMSGCVRNTDSGTQSYAFSSSTKSRLFLREDVLGNVHSIICSHGGGK